MLRFGVSVHDVKSFIREQCDGYDLLPAHCHMLVVRSPVSTAPLDPHVCGVLQVIADNMSRTTYSESQLERDLQTRNPLVGPVVTDAGLALLESSPLVRASLAVLLCGA
jgi:hypothetical protein